MDDIFTKLEQILSARKTADAQDSYVSALYAKGEDAILKKIGEESAEVLIAAKNHKTSEIVHEIADLWFHTLVLLNYKNIEFKQIEHELSRRFGTSGHTEKASRAPK